MEQRETRSERSPYQGPERRRAQLPYNGEERRRLDWPFPPRPSETPQKPDERR